MDSNSKSHGGIQLESTTENTFEGDMIQSHESHPQTGLPSMTLPDASSDQTSTESSRPGQNSPLLNLPQELQDEILLHVPRRDLSSLSKTCLALRATTLPFLFREIVVDVEFLPMSPRTKLIVQSLKQTLKDTQLAGMVKILRVTQARTGSDILDQILPHTPNLSTLLYEYLIDQARYTWSHHTDHIEAQRLSHQLNPVKDTLKHLKITYQIDVRDDYINGPVSQHCSLKHLSVLSNLKIPFFVLLGLNPELAPKLGDVLPRSLVSLSFEDDVWWAESSWNGKTCVTVPVEFVEDEKWKQFTPSLKTLDFGMRNDDESDADGAKKLGEASPLPNAGGVFFKRLCKENGLVCEVFRLPYDYWCEYLGLLPVPN